LRHGFAWGRFSPSSATASTGVDRGEHATRQSERRRETIPSRCRIQSRRSRSARSDLPGSAVGWPTRRSCSLEWKHHRWLRSARTSSWRTNEIEERPTLHNKPAHAVIGKRQREAADVFIRDGQYQGPRSVRPRRQGALVRYVQKRRVRSTSPHVQHRAERRVDDGRSSQWLKCMVLAAGASTPHRRGPVEYSGAVHRPHPILTNRRKLAERKIGQKQCRDTDSK